MGPIFHLKGRLQVPSLIKTDVLVQKLHAIENQESVSISLEKELEGSKSYYDSSDE